MASMKRVIVGLTAVLFTLSLAGCKELTGVVENKEHLTTQVECHDQAPVDGKTPAPVCSQKGDDCYELAIRPDDGGALRKFCVTSEIYKSYETGERYPKK